MSGKLLPSVPGCRALVIGKVHPTKTYLRSMEGTEVKVLSEYYGYTGPRSWYIDSPLIQRLKRSKRVAFFESGLLRIDGGDFQHETTDEQEKVQP